MTLLFILYLVRNSLHILMKYLVNKILTFKLKLLKHFYVNTAK